MVGGQDHTGPTHFVYRFDVVTDRWSAEPPSIYPHLLHGLAITPDGAVYATSSGSLPVNLERRDPVTGQWTDLGSAPMDYDQMGACVADRFGNVFCLGGYWFGNVHDDVWRYDTAANVWSACSPLPSARNNMACAISPSQQCFLLGGDPGSGSIRLRDTLLAQLDTQSLATITPFGQGCQGSCGELTLGSTGRPTLGRGLTMFAAPLPQTFTVMLGVIGFSDSALGSLPLPFDLSGIGMPGCRLLTSREVMRAEVTSVAWSWRQPLPGSPIFLGATLHAQAFAADPAGNALGLVASNGAHLTVGF